MWPAAEVGVGLAVGAEAACYPIWEEKGCL